MTRFSGWISNIGTAMANNSPWGSGSGDDGDSGSGDKPRNPWQPGGSGGSNGGERPGGGASIEDIFRKRRSGGGGGGGFGGFNGLPKRPNGKSWMPIIVAALIVIWLGFTMLHRLGPGQQGVVTTLGYYSRTVGPGINWTLPAPMQRLEKVDVLDIRTLQIGSATQNAENLVLTSDQNIIDMAYEVRWNIADPVNFLFQLDDPQAAVQGAAESAMRAAIANFKLTDAIGPKRSDIEAEVQERMQTILDSYRSGVAVQGIAIRQSDPPAEVTEAFRRVNAAQQQRESYINDAQAYASQVRERALGDTAAFDKVYEQYRLAPEVTRRRLYYETMEQVLGNINKTIVEPSGVTPYLALPEIQRRSSGSNDATTSRAQTPSSSGVGEQ